MHCCRDGLAGCSLSSQPMGSSHCYCHSMIQTRTRCLSFSRLNSVAKTWSSKCSHPSRWHASFPQQSPGCRKWQPWVFQGQEVVAGEMVFIHHLYPVQEKELKQEQEETDAHTLPFSQELRLFSLGIRTKPTTFETAWMREFSLQKHSSRNSLVILWGFNSILLYLYYLFLCYGRYSWHAIMTQNCLNILFLFSFQNHYEQLLLSSK